MIELDLLLAAVSVLILLVTFVLGRLSNRASIEDSLSSTITDHKNLKDSIISYFVINGSSSHKNYSVNLILNENAEKPEKLENVDKQYGGCQCHACMCPSCVNECTRNTVPTPCNYNSSKVNERYKNEEKTAININTTGINSRKCNSKTSGFNHEITEKAEAGETPVDTPCLSTNPKPSHEKWSNANGDHINQSKTKNCRQSDGVSVSTCSVYSSDCGFIDYAFPYLYQFDLFENYKFSASPNQLATSHPFEPSDPYLFGSDPLTYFIEFCNYIHKHNDSGGLSEDQFLQALSSTVPSKLWEHDSVKKEVASLKLAALLKKSYSMKMRSNDYKKFLHNVYLQDRYSAEFFELYNRMWKSPIGRMELDMMKVSPDFRSELMYQLPSFFDSETGLISDEMRTLEKNVLQWSKKNSESALQNRYTRFRKTFRALSYKYKDTNTLSCSVSASKVFSANLFSDDNARIHSGTRLINSDNDFATHSKSFSGKDDNDTTSAIPHHSSYPNRLAAISPSRLPHNFNPNLVENNIYSSKYESGMFDSPPRVDQASNTSSSIKLVKTSCTQTNNNSGLFRSDPGDKKSLKSLLQSPKICTFSRPSHSRLSAALSFSEESSIALNNDSQSQFEEEALKIRISEKFSHIIDAKPISQNNISSCSSIDSRINTNRLNKNDTVTSPNFKPSNSLNAVHVSGSKTWVQDDPAIHSSQSSNTDTRYMSPNRSASLPFVKHNLYIPSYPQSSGNPSNLKDSTFTQSFSKSDSSENPAKSSNRYSSPAPFSLHRPIRSSLHSTSKSVQEHELLKTSASDSSHFGIKKKRPLPSIPLPSFLTSLPKKNKDKTSTT